MTRIPVIHNHIGAEMKLLEEAFECLYLEEERSIEHYQSCAEAAHKLTTSLNHLTTRLQEKIGGKL